MHVSVVDDGFARWMSIRVKTRLAHADEQVVNQVLRSLSWNALAAVLGHAPCISCPRDVWFPVQCFASFGTYILLKERAPHSPIAIYANKKIQGGLTTPRCARVVPSMSEPKAVEPSESANARPKAREWGALADTSASTLSSATLPMFKDTRMVRRGSVRLLYWTSMRRQGRTLNSDSEFCVGNAGTVEATTLTPEAA
ncbi:hypothetical protein BV22DRAFT_1042310 [Leucogyrophana mollusca]|uniref:Uncharacterized protein n=1 Tax=Leucogyrophana mollusca TaxID=85980 RepID=A0ACB8AYA7_9AGAM|nr:hypothetical protein BV22DRAFT_1042310 [Leucogyrophana mollusca]